MASDQLPDYGRHLAVSITNACPLQCGHCISNSSPKSRQGFQGLAENFAGFLDLWPKARHVTLTGGEPFYDLAGMKLFLELCVQREVRAGAITSGYWAKTPKAAAEMLNKVPRLHSLTISSDVFHQQYVSVDFIANAYRAGRERGLLTHVRLTRHAETKDDERELRAKILDFCDPEDLEDALLAPYGRAEEFREELARSTPREAKLGLCPSSGPHIFESGRVTPCCNSIVSLEQEHALDFGNILGEPSSAVKARLLSDEFFLTIKILGFDFLRDYLDEIGELDFAPVSACEFCFQLCKEPRQFRKLESLFKNPEFRFQLHAIAIGEYGNHFSGAPIKSLVATHVTASEMAPELEQATTPA
jgi:organic radical activating enzyme